MMGESAQRVRKLAINEEQVQYGYKYILLDGTINVERATRCQGYEHNPSVGSKNADRVSAYPKWSFPVDARLLSAVLL